MTNDEHLTIRHSSFVIRHSLSCIPPRRLAYIAAMKALLRFCTLLLLLTCAAPAAEKGPVYVVPVRTTISPTQFVFLRRAVKEAERGGASAIVLDMDTNGGRL